jgi:AraC-like DNA-binding protein
VIEICLDVGLQSVGSFTTSFKKAYGVTPTQYRAAHLPASAHINLPACVVRAYGRPQRSTFGEDRGETRD